jgi:hypothetical protein
MLLVANLTLTIYKLIFIKIKATDTLVWENIIVVPSAVPINELVQIRSENVKAKTIYLASYHNMAAHL